MLKSLLILFEEWLGPGYYHIVIEIGLVVAVYQLFTTRPKRPKTSNSNLSEKERQQLIGKYFIIVLLVLLTLALLTLRRPLRHSWRIGLFFSSHGSALTAIPKR